ncbi:hypothetical protein A1OK_02920 [Enterovibrio norvegicus FF-454]|uniref:AMP-dependent synthetase/ligase domain-containing protein n=2 Tax=Enterovibrio norvegicus TaxID=188144 RepID=A0A1E5C0D1_9GAMM|nr:AMP-binding protein [Enterovibrio norvegicus]OEE58974.1 hypothetical protein A1OK_02920 [Enterovibrio norvegicus FF-454]
MRDTLYNIMVEAGDRIAVLDQDKSYRYQDVLNDAALLHEKLSLAAEGKPSGTHILMSAQRSYTSVVMYVFSVVYGYTLVPVTAEIDNRSLERLINELPVAFFFTDASTSRLLTVATHSDCPTLVAQCGGLLHQGVFTQSVSAFSFSKAKMAATSSHASPSQDNPDLYLIFTSGSTGNPKGVSVETHNLLNYLETTRDEFGICADDVLSHISPLSFDFSIHEIFIALFNQAAIAVLRENDKFNFSGYLLRHAVSVWASVPSTLAYLNKTRQLNPNQYPALRLAFVGGEPVHPSLLYTLSLAAPNCTVYSYYGPTECTVAMMAYRYDPTQEYAQHMPLGRPFGGHRVFIQTEKDGAFHATGTGEAYIAGPQVLKAYWKNPEQTALRFSYHPEHGYMFRTGDMIRIEDDGNHVFIARQDDDIKIGGYRFNTAACRTFVEEVSEAEDVVVTPFSHSTEGTFDRLLVVTVNAKITEAALARIFRDQYDNYVQPHFINVSELPRNRNGKLDKKALMEKVACHV